MGIQYFNEKINLNKEDIPNIINLLIPFYQTLNDIKYIDSFPNLCDLINRLYEIVKTKKNEKDKEDDYQIIIILKICYYLIKYCEVKKKYKKNKEIQKQFEQVKNNIKKRLLKFNDLNKIKEILIRIINGLIELQIFINCKFVKKIIKIFNIEIYKFDNIFEKLQSKDLEQYYIKSTKDLLPKNINFYYIYLKYIRNNYDINKIPHLNETKSAFLESLNKNEFIHFDNKKYYVISQLFKESEFEKLALIFAKKNEDNLMNENSSFDVINNYWKEDYEICEENEFDKELKNIEKENDFLDLEAKEKTDINFTSFNSDEKTNLNKNIINEEFSEKNNLLIESDYIKVIEYKRVIEDKNNTNGLFKILRNGYCIGLGANNSLNVYDSVFTKKFVGVTKYDDKIIDFFEVKNNEENVCQIIAYGKEKYFLLL